MASNLLAFFYSPSLPCNMESQHQPTRLSTRLHWCLRCRRAGRETFTATSLPLGSSRQPAGNTTGETQASCPASCPGQCGECGKNGIFFESIATSLVQLLDRRRKTHPSYLSSLFTTRKLPRPLECTKLPICTKRGCLSAWPI